MLQKTVKIAKENKCDYLMSVANTKELFHIFYTNGFKCVREIHFNSFLDCGQRIFRRRMTDESETLNLMFLKINESMPDPKMQS
uniref:N-acetyltransferase domain-containing protein n=1 Tax=Panagrolaimus sp. PS1159 TaxID=55785 RepID=A0AC35FHD1_9BILA